LTVFFGERVHRARLRRRWSQEELAHKAGLHPTYISGVERGRRNPTLDVVERIAQALNVSVASLLKM
jgi:transcriptional regulator with XRE-family HTH domain